MAGNLQVRTQCSGIRIGKDVRAKATVLAVPAYRAAEILGEIYPVIYQQTVAAAPIGLWEIATTLGFLGLWGWLYFSFLDAFPRMRVVLMTSPYRDEVQVPVDPRTMEPLPAHE